MYTKKTLIINKRKKQKIKCSHLLLFVGWHILAISYLHMHSKGNG